MNPHVRAAMPKGSLLLDITDEDRCSCSICGGPFADAPFDVEAERKRYARKGWSAAKVSRAIEAKQAAHARRGVGSNAEEFCPSIQALVHAGARITLISHLYDGMFSEEVVSVGARVRISLADLLKSQGAFPTDTLVTIE